MAGNTTAALHPPGAIYEQAALFATALEAQQEGASSRMLDAWAAAYHRARIEYDTLLAKVEAAKAAGQPMSPAWLYQRDRLKNAISTTKVEIAKYAEHASAETKAAQWSAIQAAVKHAAKLGQTAMVGAGLHGGFDSLDEAHLRHLVGFLEDGSPLAELFSGLADETAAQITDALTVGLAHGKGNAWMARRVDEALDMPRWRAETIMRTESQRVYRATADATYQANAEVLSSWVWTAKLDSRTCPCCIVMDGTEHPIGTRLDGHPRCRCAMVPRTKSWADLGIGDVPDTRPPVRSGKAWLEGQPDDVQRELLGRAKFNAWKSGQISLDDVVARTESPKWGTMRRERSLREITNGVHPNYVDAVEVHHEPAPLTANPRAVRAIIKANTPEQIGEALDGDDLDAQQRVNYQAAHYANAQKAGFSVALPEPDDAKATKAADKMANAAITKGYPSKGYSQTVAIYKAQANGKPGTKVGVVKSLTWEQKLTAQRALEKHDAWLADWTAKQAEQHEKAKAILQELKFSQNGATSEDASHEGFKHAQQQINALEPGPEKNRAQAAWDALFDQHQDAVQAAKDKHAQSATWTPPKSDDPWAYPQDATLTVDDDGWGHITYGDGGSPQHVTPGTVNKLADAGWQPHIEPDPAKVKGWVQNFTTTDGTLDTDKIKSMEELLNDPSAPWDPQAKAEISEAVAEAKATLTWPPQQDVVDVMVDILNEGDLTPDALQAKADNQPNNKQYAANVKAALEQHAAQQQAQSAASFLDKLLNMADEDDAGTSVGAAPDAAGLHFTGQVLGTHGAKVYTDDAGTRWLFKPPKDASDGFLTTLDEAASRLQARAGLTAPDTFVVTLDGKRGSIQRMFDSHNAFDHGGFRPTELGAADMAAVQREHVLDWLLSNHDGHLEQFQRLPDGTLVGIDKGQAFRWMGQDRLAWDFHPNAAYGAPEPVYNALWREFAQGRDVDLLDPHHDGPLRDQIEAIQAISDDDLRAMLRPYAEQAAAQGKLAVRQSQPGLTKPTIPPNDVDAFLDAVVARKNRLQDDFNDLYDRAAKARAKALPGWKPTKPARPAKASVASWQGAPAPTMPEPPVEPDTSHVTALFDPWLVKVKGRYAQGPGKSAGKTLEQSNNWARIRRVIDDHDEAALQELADRKYLDDALLAEGKRIIQAAKKAKADALVDYNRERDKWIRARKAWAKDMAAWRDANGIQDALLGMDEGVQRHKSTKEGTTWAEAHWKMDGWTAQERTKLRYYTSSSGASSLNNTGRRLGEGGRDPSAWGSEAATVKVIDKAMGKQPVTEDVIVNRGTGLDAFVLAVGRRAGSGDKAAVLQELPGTVQREWGYLSTSVGDKAAFGGAALLKLRVPAGTRAAYVDAFSHFKGSEFELLLDRGTRYYVHAVYESGGRLIVEAEVVGEDFQVPLNADGSPITYPSMNPWK